MKIGDLLWRGRELCRERQSATKESRCYSPDPARRREWRQVMKEGEDRCAGVQALHPTDLGNDYPAPSSAPLLSGSGLTPRSGIVAKV